MSEILSFSIAFENNRLNDRCFTSAIEIVFSCFLIFSLRVLLPTLNAVHISPKKPAKLAVKRQLSPQFHSKKTAIPLVDNTADVTPVTVLSDKRI